MSEKLLPCPFCGSADVVADHDSYQNWYVICNECGAEMHDLAPDLANQHWNRRSSPRWQPIETAPKDGTVIDVWLGGIDKLDADFYCTPGTLRSCGWAWKEGKFRPLGGLPHAMPTFIKPTHWQPLPAGPEQAGE